MATDITEIDRLSDELCESPRGMWEACVDCPDQGLALIGALIGALPVIKGAARSVHNNDLDAVDDLFATFGALVKAKATIDAEEAENSERQESCEDAESKYRREIFDRGEA